MGLRVHLQSQKETPWIGNILTRPLKKIQIEPSVKRTMVTVFCLLLCEFLPPKISTAKNTAKLKKLRKAIKRMRPGSLTAGVRLLHDGNMTWHFSPDSSLVAKVKWEVLQHPP
jgi:hypothetical protein